MHRRLLLAVSLAGVLAQSTDSSAQQVSQQDLLNTLPLLTVKAGTLESIGDMSFALKRGQVVERFKTNERSALCVDGKRVTSLNEFSKHLGKLVTVATILIAQKSPTGEEHAVLIQFPFFEGEAALMGDTMRLTKAPGC